MFGLGWPEVFIVCLVCLWVGTVMGRPVRRTAEGALWGLLLGPVGLAIFYFRVQQLRHGADDSTPG